MATCDVPSPQPDIDSLLKIYIQTAEDLITQCQQLELKDAKKLEKKCRAELKYLQSLGKRKKPKDEIHMKIQEHDLKSSNLSHFAAILHAANNLPRVKKILCPFSSKGRADSMIVDIVALDGNIWVKVIARKAQALHLIWAGKGQYGDRDIVRQAEDYLRCATEHPINFIIPEVHYAFYNEVTESMASALEAIGVRVWGTRIPVSQEVQYLVDTSASISDDNFSDNGNSHCNEDSENVNSDDEDDDCHIPSASEFKSNDTNISYGSDLPNKSIIPRSVADLFDNSNCSYRYNNKNVNSIHKHLSDSFKPDSTTIDTSKLKHCVSSKNDKVISETYQGKRQEILSQILGSAPVYSIPETHISGVVTEQCNETTSSNRVNLDITTMITLVSSITHGGCNYVFQEKILSMQAKEERESPVLPELHKYLKDKEMFVCRTAVEDFQTILDTLGGENEKLRGTELLDRCTIVPDQPSPRSQKLPHTGKIRERSKIIFGTGDQLKCVTVSANSGFVRAAEHQGIVFAVYLHQSRALTEKKEKQAKRIED